MTWRCSTPLKYLATMELWRLQELSSKNHTSTSHQVLNALCVMIIYLSIGTAPETMEAMAMTLRAADCFIIVTPEYNHSIPPALSSLMGHFGSSCYGFKPSGTLFAWWLWYVWYKQVLWHILRVRLAVRAPLLPCDHSYQSWDAYQCRNSHVFLHRIQSSLRMEQW